MKMKIAWILIFTLLLVVLFDPAKCWRRRRTRFRRRILHRISRILPIIEHYIDEYSRVRVRWPPAHFNRRRNIPSQITTTPTLPSVTQRQYRRTTAGTSDPCPEICAGKCPFPSQCSTWHCPCQWVCSTVCDWFREEEFIWPYDGYAVPLPCDFEQYDGDGDGGISPEELAFMVRMRSRDENNLAIFNKMDQNFDGNVSSAEFYSFRLLKNCE